MRNMWVHSVWKLKTSFSAPGKHVKPKDSPTLKCDECIQFFTYDSHLIVHKKKHTQQKEWVCSNNAWHYVFSTKRRMKQHRWMHDEKDVQCLHWVKKLCAKYYLDDNIYQKHVRYSRTICGYIGLYCCTMLYHKTFQSLKLLSMFSIPDNRLMAKVFLILFIYFS